MTFKESFTLIRLLLKYPFSINSQMKLKKLLIEEASKTIKLTMIVFADKNTDFLNTYINFHSLMGVDTFLIVETATHARPYTQENRVEYTSATDIKIIYEIIKEKFNSNYVILANLDEFYFSKNNNIKLAIASLQTAEVLNPTYKLAFTTNDDILQTTHFISRNFRDFECTAFNIEKKKYQELDNFVPYPIYKFTTFLENHQEFILDNKLVNNQLKLECSDVIVYKFQNFSKNLLNEEEFLTSHGIINKDFKLLNFLNKNKLL